MFNKPKNEIWAVGGGKGGVGKSIITANMAIAMGQRSCNVLLVDADFGAANLHTVLGIQPPDYSLTDFFQSNIPLEGIIQPTGIANLSLIGGAQDSLRSSNPEIHQIQYLGEKLRSLDYDVVMIDLGAGTLLHTIELFTMADKGILITMPEAASIENTYRFLKYGFYRYLYNDLRNESLRGYLENLINSKENDHITPAMLIERMQSINPVEADKMRRSIQSYSMKLVINQVRNNNDVRLGFSIAASCQKYFGFHLDYVGFLEYDEMIVATSKSRRPLFIAEPFSKASRGLRKVVENLINNQQEVSSVV